jgi:signal transduction histidine kinase
MLMYLLFGGLVLVSAYLVRGRPSTALIALLAGSWVAALTSESRHPAVLIVLAATAGIELCFIAATRPTRVGVAAGSVACAATALALLILDARLPLIPHAGAIIVCWLTYVIAWLIGRSIRQTHVHSENLRAQAALQAVTAERLRIARELHDIVAHSIGVIAIQAGAGSRVIETHPDQAQRALTAIEAASRETLAGLRRMLGALREAEPGPGTGPASVTLGPASGLADVDRLAAVTQESGIQVDVRWLGERRPLPPDLDLSAFRIVQEAVTNVMRHAGASQCRICVDQTDDQVKIEVVDNGRGGAISGPGYGITGMRERVSLLGGEFHAGPRPGGGCRVAARLPLPQGTMPNAVVRPAVATLTSAAP